jgi:hypothetical protein
MCSTTVKFWCVLLYWTLELSLLLRFLVFVKGKQSLCGNVRPLWSFDLQSELNTIIFGKLLVPQLILG